jgi:hypothetical protein
MSKNVEATGERRRPYDEWRMALRSLPQGSHISLNVEYSPSPGEGYPHFDIHCLIDPLVLNKTDAFSNEQYEEAVNKVASKYAAHHHDWLSRLGVPVIAAVADYGLTTFAIRDILSSEPVAFLKRADFVNDVIRQSFKDGRDSNPYVADLREVTRYSTWHRAALTNNNSLLTEVNYVELRDDSPVALIERTQARNDLKRTFFDFMSRGFAQGMLLLQAAEKLGVRCFCTVYLQDMSRLLVVELNRTVLEMAKPMNPERQRLSREFQTNEGLPYRQAQGKASAAVYDKYSNLLDKMLAATTHNEYTLAEYEAWLVGLP